MIRVQLVGARVSIICPLFNWDSTAFLIPCSPVPPLDWFCKSCSFLKSGFNPIHLKYYSQIKVFLSNATAISNIYKLPKSHKLCILCKIQWNLPEVRINKWYYTLRNSVIYLVVCFAGVIF